VAPQPIEAKPKQTEAEQVQETPSAEAAAEPAVGG
jgi:hypothetical protein